MAINLTHVERTISRSRFLSLKKDDETSDIPAHSSAAYAVSVGENYVLPELPTEETGDQLADEEVRELH
jgi:hypothetical protein